MAPFATIFSRVRISPFFLFWVLPFFFAGCLTVPSASERLSTADAIAQEAGLHRSKVRASPFLLTAYSRIQEPPGKDLHIYIEGDGYAWASRHRVSGDPTPRRPVALELAAEDPAPNVVYLARPCQYTPMEIDSVCDEAYWTDKRFSEEVVNSMDQAVSKFVKDAQSSGVHLIGYSGGGAVAALIAARRQDVKSLRTVAGNLDPNGFNEYHEVSPLDKDSLDPMEVAGKLSAIPQYHFTGSEDSIVPALFVEHFAEKEGESPCVRIRNVSGADHVNGWVEAWPGLLKLPLSCWEEKD